MKQKVIIIVGPTASGKSALGVDLARALNGEVISADSRQVYRGLNIGTGKITKREMRGVRHHLLDVASPKKAFSAADFKKRADKAIFDISHRGKLPIIVGGTAFYIDTLLGRVTLPEVPPDSAFRKSKNKLPVGTLFGQLKRLDPQRAAAMATSPSERNNKVRIIRALEIARALGKTPPHTESAQYDALWVGIAPKDEDLKRRIHTRLKERIQNGMVKEAKRLHEKGVSYKRMKELGLEYRSLARLLSKEIPRSQLELELQSDIWRYARKQIGYWKRNKDIEWFDAKSKKILPTVRSWLQK